MADVLAIIGLVSAIVQFVDFGSKIVGRLNEYKEAGNNVPKTFQKISVDLPLVINNLKRTKDQADAGEISDETAKVLKPVIEACLLQTKRLERLLENTLPAEGDSSWRRRMKAVASLADGKAVQKIMSELESHLPHLLYSQTLNGSAPGGQTVVQETAQPSRLGTQSRRHPCFIVKFARNKNFVGREDIIKEISGRFLDRQPCVAITGVGGVGKSQIAIEYCYRYRQDHPEAHIFWVHASTPTRFAVAYQRLGEELALPDVNNPDVDTIELVQKWLSNDANGPWLLVLDNADDIEMVFGSEDGEEQPIALINHLPQSLNGSIIVTTRDSRIGQRLAPMEKPIAILPFEKEDAIILLRKMLNEDDLDLEYSTALLEALDFVPMAITQAAAFIRENGISLREYLGFLQANDSQAKNLLAETYYDPGRDRESQNSVFQTWKISFDCIRKQKSRAADILALMALFDRHAIPKTLLWQGNESEVDFATAMGTLKAFSLVAEEGSNGMFSMHRLIQLSTQKWLELEGVIEEWQKRAIDTVSRMCTADYIFADDWKIWRAISPHAQVVLGFGFQSEPFLLERAVILHRLAIHDIEEGYFISAHARAQESLATIQKLEGGHPKKLAIARTMAHTLCTQRKFEASEKIHRELLEEQQAALGPNHSETLVSLDFIAESLAFQGKYEQAEALQRQILEAWTTSPELATHTFRFSCYSILAYTLEMQCKYEEAEEKFRKALDGHTEVFGAEHPFTSHALYGLGSVLMRQGKVEAAETITRRLVRNNERSLGPRHTLTLKGNGNLAYILGRQKKWEEAEQRGRRAFRGFESLYGQDHEETLHAMVGLSRILAGQHKFEEAESALRHALGRFEEKFGPDYQDTVSVLSHLSHDLGAQRRYEEAEAVSLRAFHGSEICFGPKHPYTALCLGHVAFARAFQGKYEAVVTMCLPLLNGYMEELGPRNIALSPVLDWVAEALSHLGRYEEAELFSRQASATYEEVSGFDDPYTLSAFTKLAFILENQEKLDEAEVIRRRVLDGQEKILGPEHAETLSTVYALASILHLRMQYEQASILYQRACPALQKTLGPDNYITVRCVEGLAALQSFCQYQRRTNPKYFPRIRRLIGFLARSKAT